MFVPLQFWFNRNPGLALPLIALQYHEVKLNLTFAASTAVFDETNGTHSMTCKLWCDYIYLDTDERRRFAQVSHEYLIEQLNTLTMQVLPLWILFWTTQLKNWSGPVFQHLLLLLVLMVHLHQVLLVKIPSSLNLTVTIVSLQETENTSQKFNEHHSGYGGIFDWSCCRKWHCSMSWIHRCLLFWFEPEEHQPSGTCNSPESILLN